MMQQSRSSGSFGTAKAPGNVARDAVDASDCNRRAAREIPGEIPAIMPEFAMPA